MKRLFQHRQFKKDFVRVKLSDQHLEKFLLYVAALLEERGLPKEARDHSLAGEWSSFREFHLGGDMLVVYQLEEERVCLARIGTHAQLFRSM